MTLATYLVIVAGSGVFAGSLCALLGWVGRRRRLVGLLGMVLGAAVFVWGLELVEAGRRMEVIHVVAGQYGRNCDAPPGNDTQRLTSVCEGKSRLCYYRVDHHAIGDPCWAVHKDYLAEWRCGDGDTLHEFTVVGEASGHDAILSCSTAVPGDTRGQPSVALPWKPAEGEPGPTASAPSVPDAVAEPER